MDNMTMNYFGKSLADSWLLTFAMPKPSRVTFSGNVTICFWPDGSKEMVRCKDGDEFDEEYAVAMCIAHHIFRSKNQFKKFVASAYSEPTKEERKLAKEERKSMKSNMDEFPF